MKGLKYTYNRGQGLKYTLISQITASENTDCTSTRVQALEQHYSTSTRVLEATVIASSWTHHIVDLDVAIGECYSVRGRGHGEHEGKGGGDCGW